MWEFGLLLVVIVAGDFCDAWKEVRAAPVFYVGESAELHAQTAHVKASVLE